MKKETKILNRKNKRDENRNKRIQGGSGTAKQWKIGRIKEAGENGTDIGLNLEWKRRCGEN